MDQNVLKCQECMNRIKKKLDELGYSNIMYQNNILVKAPRLSHASKIGGGIKISQSATSECKCRGSIISDTIGCPYRNTCNVDKNDCPLNNKDCNCEFPSDNNNKFTSGYDCLFRVRPSDIQNGITLHAIILHGETCELKMLFEPNINGENEIIKTIQFLV